MKMKGLLLLHRGDCNNFVGWRQRRPAEARMCMERMMKLEVCW